MLFTTAVTGFLYYRVRNTGLKALNRERQSFAVRALKDMDSSTLKKVLGQVGQICQLVTFEHLVINKHLDPVLACLSICHGFR